MTAKAPTDRQQEVYDFFIAFIRENGIAPSVRDVMAGVGIGSPNGVSAHIEALIRKGKLRRVGVNKSRGIVPVTTDGECLFCGHAHAAGDVK